VDNFSLESGREVVAGDEVILRDVKMETFVKRSNSGQDEKEKTDKMIMVELEQQLRATGKLAFVPLQVTRKNIKSKVKDVEILTEEEMDARVEEVQGEGIKVHTVTGGNGVARTTRIGLGRGAGTSRRKPRIAAKFCGVADPSDRFEVLAKLVDSSSLESDQEVIAGDEVTPQRGLEVEAFVERSSGKDEVQLQQVERRKQVKGKTDKIDIRNLEQHQVYVHLQVSKEEVNTKMKDVEGEAEEELGTRVKVVQGEGIKQGTVTRKGTGEAGTARRKPRIAANFGGVAPQ